MRALIVDDEPIARIVLREGLELLDSIKVVGEAENGEAALLKISSAKPDIVFLDIQMPGMSGFELLDHLNGGHLPAIVMVTAYDQHARCDSFALHFLVDDRRLFNKVAECGRGGKGSVRLRFQTFDSLVTNLDLVRICASVDNKFLLKVEPVRTKANIDSRPGKS